MNENDLNKEGPVRVFPTDWPVLILHYVYFDYIT